MPSQLVMISWNDGDTPFPVDPGFGVPGRPNYPSQGLPGYGRPDNSLPGNDHISLLPVFPFDPTLSPDNSLPGSQPAPGNDLPRPGKRYIMKWLACRGLILVPDNSLPETPEPK